MRANTQRCTYLATGLCCLTCWACGPAPSLPLRPESPHTTLQEVVFNRMDGKGQLLWELRAEFVKMDNTEKVSLRQIQGTFYHDQAPIYRLRASEGQIQQSSHFIQLQGPIVVEDLGDRSTLHSQDLQWHPKTGELKARSGVKLEHPHFTLSGQQFQASAQDRNARLSGQATLQLKDQNWTINADQIAWLSQQRKLYASSPQPTLVSIQATVPSRAFPWQQVQATAIEWDLAAQDLIFHKEVKLTHANPGIELRSPKVILDLTQQQWRSPLGIRLQHPSLTATANQGWFDASGTLHLNSQVQMQDLPHQGHLHAQTVMWNMTTQHIKAEGNLIYHQSMPSFKLTGVRAQGNLRQQTLEIEGGEAVIEIIP
ncbi:LPS export ABC transporter periplasmic protein LptC [Acaryochloris sp. IP29b_bin.137]|uniref:LPS export ABC transporter periplasmic protein LptC n=1 Tax=Acaryochloris sp. IP29b_bin.137 TaxID=2969217 RepID=UPI002613874B|nr:LPS export ABC transporter periplasmic protein LptC [Acaryochloris sp. IP29b_bin.137]